ncbi:hypothetical protein HYH02_012335 [Chlamydomonas schloesseri]|uniref:Uncharacterized protein n=1 Tax=Chlamydomonas schloesseri TaxID=2026947 RepID=A0A835T1T6_9CHLO|nr:hypothetical protein HYH02_012335 [Chlamydomonas schloesseri]|eukprot:KAG2434313.1 hypothetical protein HYH02_012335 [Chlamydomonas schloesseri]
MTLSMDDCGRALKYVIDSGAFDTIRKTVMEELKKSTSLRAAVLAEVEKSATMANPEKRQGKDTKHILDELNRELKSTLTDMTTRAAWELLTSDTDSQASKELEVKVLEALNRLAEKRELQQQQQQKQGEAAPAAASSTPAPGPARQPSAAAAEALGGATGTTTSTLPTAFLPAARPTGAAPVTASLAPAAQARETQQQQLQQQQQQGAPPQRTAPRYGLVGNS